MPCFGWRNWGEVKDAITKLNFLVLRKASPRHCHKKFVGRQKRDISILRFKTRFSKRRPKLGLVLIERISC